ncbi:putative DNA-binding WGR domain protein [Rhizobium sp. BK077]|uniref:WGR domain-containing protein n=1 Tax=unclassified Rhizobium TaxID=2613769 RepID=UPI00179DCB1F|nr:MULTISPECIES: WGR domain-containing protein [unclassified Rhizobium]MBB3299929.1 putative DNA-binding WGR domain protein [Rhizobium sp. BK112]MBB3369386.1 putative DNA-binding WGR domain protein [Rhizobium sp. BK077]MBB4180069.1 putative DNA-binding WGR domain protein [Rhizobium sp. BK109]
MLDRFSIFIGRVGRCTGFLRHDPGDPSDIAFSCRSGAKHGRFYLLAVEPTLFGGSSLTRCWGRMGTKGQVKIDLFDTAVEARQASRKLLHGKLKRGYRRNEEDS